MRDSIVWDVVKIVGTAFVGVLILAVGFLGWGLYKPASVWRLARPAVLGSDVRESWTKADWTFKRENGFHWRFELSVLGYHLERKAPKLDVTTDIAMSGYLRFFSSQAGLEIENLDIHSTTPGIYEKSAPSADQKPSNPHQMAENIRNFLLRLENHIRLRKLKLDVADIEIQNLLAQPLHLNWTAQKPTDEKSPNLSSKAILKGEKEQIDILVTSDLTALDAGSPFLQVDVQGQGENWQLKAKGDLALPHNQGLVRGEISGSYGAEPRSMKFKSSLSSNIMEAKMLIQGIAQLENLPGGITAVRDVNWNVDLPLWKGVILDHLSGQMTVDGKVSLEFMGPKVRAQVEESCKCKWPENLQVNMNGKVWPAHLIAGEGEDRPITSLNFNVEGLKNALIDLSMVGELRVARDKDHQYQITPTVDGDLKLPNFQALKALLELNHIIIPAPLDVLQGSIEAKVKTTLWQSTKGIVMPIEVRTNLSTQVQKVLTNGKVTLYVPDGFRSLDVAVDLNIDELTLELPPIDPIQGIPKLTKDSRVLSEPPAKGEGPEPFKVRVTYAMRTTKPGAIRLLSKLAKPAMPISLDLDRTVKGDILGSVKLEPFDLLYLHRTIHVDLMRVILDERDNADFAVDGRLRIDQTQAKIYISISGSLQSPLIKLNSEPELSRADIISVLLYDRTSDQLVAVDRETVGTFDAAISDRAVGLLGLWVFASTPIRSFSYNPLTKVYTATVQLAEGTTASIGTDWEQAAQLEVRKRVNRRWVLTASWAPSSDKAQSGKLVLQWEKRF